MCGREGLIDLGMVFSRARRNGCVNVEALFRRASAPTWRGIRSYNVCCTGSDLTLRVCSVRERPNAVARTRPYCVPGLQMQVSGVRGKLTSNALFYFRQSGGRGGDGETCQVLSKPRNQKHFCLKGERKASELQQSGNLPTRAICDATIEYGFSFAANEPYEPPL